MTGQQYSPADRLAIAAGYVACISVFVGIVAVTGLIGGMNL